MRLLCGRGLTGVGELLAEIGNLALVTDGLGLPLQRVAGQLEQPLLTCLLLGHQLTWWRLLGGGGYRQEQQGGEDYWTHM